MSKKFFAVLLASVALPLAAHAQDAPAPADTQDPAMMQQAPTGGAATGEASEALPGAGAGDARGGVTDVPTTDDTAGAATDPATGTADTAGSATDPAAPTADTADSMTTDPAASTADTSTMTGDSGQQTAGMASEGPFVTVPETGAWRVSDLEGTAVYGADGESIGDIGDVLVDQQGRVAAVIIGVGGFLGIGEKDVAVSMEALQFQPGELAAQAGTGAMTEGVAPGQDMAAGQGMAAGEGTVTGTAPAVGETGSTAVRDPIADPLTGGTPEATGDAAQDVQVGPDGMPDRIVLNVTKEQLEDAPEFRGIGAAVQQRP